MSDFIRIANGQGFWGDSVDAPVHLVRHGRIDYLTLDYLAEVTLSIMQRQRLRNPGAGFARDFVELMHRILPRVSELGIRIITNAGGVNPKACCEALMAEARKQGTGLKIGLVEGDDILEDLDRLVEQGAGLRNMETGEELSTIRDRITSANVYIDSFCIAEALDLGAQIVLAGRVSDPGLALGPMIHEFGWRRDDWDRLAAGTVAGHITECGAQCTGGNYSRWWEIEDYAGIGYPAIEIDAGGEFVITKPDGSGGLVNRLSITEQILYEMGDPRNYISPDVRVDFTSLDLEEESPDRVLVKGVRGLPATDTFKVSISYLAGYKAASQLTISGPRALDKAKKVAEIIWERLRRECCEYEDTLTEYLGVDTCHPGIGVHSGQVNEVVLRLAVRDRNRKKVDRFGKELAPVITNGPPGITGFAGGRPKAQEIVAYWPALIPKSLVRTKVTVESS